MHMRIENRMNPYKKKKKKQETEGTGYFIVKTRNGKLVLFYVGAILRSCHFT